MVISFSIHSPLAGRDLLFRFHRLKLFVFNPLAPCGARQKWEPCLNCKDIFSIHSPLAGRDVLNTIDTYPDSFFQSTRPLRGETAGELAGYMILTFSIHSPLAGRDRSSRAFWNFYGIFNPLAPCGARRKRPCRKRLPGQTFSIHSPLAGRDVLVCAPLRALCDFSIHSPLAGRDATVETASEDIGFSIHSPLAGRDCP